MAFLFVVVASPNLQLQDILTVTVKMLLWQLEPSYQHAHNILAAAVGPCLSLAVFRHLQAAQLHLRQPLQLLLPRVKLVSAE